MEQAHHPDPVNVLCVDDNDANLKLVETFLQEMGAHVKAVPSGEAALEALREQRFDLIFMDVQMPGMDGRETTEEIRLSEEQSASPATPIIALTAHALADEKRKLLKCGMNDYLSKPISPEQLRESIRKWTKHDLSPNRTQTSQAVNPDRANPSSRVLDPEEGLRLAAGKADLAGEMLEMLLRNLPLDRKQIEQALDDNDQKQLLETVHKLHGATRYCGVPDLRKCCLQAETRLKQQQHHEREIRHLLEAIDRLQASVSAQ
jgi:two-component system sensor histidine kinase BarA